MANLMSICGLFGRTLLPFEKWPVALYLAVPQREEGKHDGDPVYVV